MKHLHLGEFTDKPNAIDNIIAATKDIRKLAQGLKVITDYDTPDTETIAILEGYFLECAEEIRVYRADRAHRISPWLYTGAFTFDSMILLMKGFGWVVNAIERKNYNTHYTLTAPSGKTWSPDHNLFTVEQDVWLYACRWKIFPAKDQPRDADNMEDSEVDHAKS